MVWLKNVWEKSDDNRIYRDSHVVDLTATGCSVFYGKMNVSSVKNRIPIFCGGVCEFLVSFW